MRATLNQAVALTHLGSSVLDSFLGTHDSISQLWAHTDLKRGNMATEKTQLNGQTLTDPESHTNVSQTQF